MPGLARLRYKKILRLYKGFSGFYVVTCFITSSKIPSSNSFLHIRRSLSKLSSTAFKIRSMLSCIEYSALRRVSSSIGLLGLSNISSRTAADCRAEHKILSKLIQHPLERARVCWRCNSFRRLLEYLEFRLLPTPKHSN